MPGIRTSIRTTSGCSAGRLRQCRRAVGRLAGDGDPFGVVEYHAEPGSHQLLVVDDEHPDRRRWARVHRAGSLAVTAKPSSASVRPPSCRRRRPPAPRFRPARSPDPLTAAPVPDAGHESVTATVT